MSDPLDDLTAPPGEPPSHAAAPYLRDLNPVQREAVEALDGPVLVLAGAGTGKTRVLTTRLAHLLFTRRARPYQILAVTFTNKAAREMKDRVERLVGGVADGIWLGTFHSLGARFLRRHAELVGLRSNFTILDTDDQIRLLRQILEAEHIDEKRWPARMLISVIQRWKDKGMTPDKVRAGDAGELANGRLIEIYRQYQERLSVLNAADFGDLLLLCLELFLKNPDVLAEYQRLFHYILVDEYQDTNVAQYLWLRLLAQGHKNICCVGDDDQSIYGWRGAEVDNILRFEKDFPGAKVIRLEQNYRSTPHILAAASGLIACNEGRLGKTLWTDRTEGEPLTVRGVWDGEEEARIVGDEIEALQRKGHKLDEIAILVRAGFQTREFEERFITLGLPYRVIGGPRFYEREEIRDAIAYLRVIHQQDDDLALERIVNKPARGVGQASLQAVHALARAQGIPLYIAAIKLVQSDELRPAARRSLGAILNDFERWRGLAEAASHVELAKTVLDESGYTAFWQNSKKPEAPGKLENLKELVTALEDFENLAGFLEHVSLVMENAENSGDDMVSLMTLHSAKGLEFDTVFLPGWEEGLFPHQRSMDENGVAGLEEERRLAYVGLTRARQRVMISFAANRRIYNQWQSAIPSRFVEELPPEQVSVESDRGLYPGAIDSSFQASGGAAAGSPARGGPGWQRLQSRGLGARLIEAEPEALHGSGAGFARGDRCFHQKFGMGLIRIVEGDHLTIEFDNAGTKKVVAAFVEKT
ncbi:MAG: AAA family ATPase [Alphaproteobacteria bacterium]|nr:AAA family ATPase [Alphaproteobacteria bacterium]